MSVVYNQDTDTYVTDLTATIWQATAFPGNNTLWRIDYTVDDSVLGTGNITIDRGQWGVAYEFGAGTNVGPGDHVTFGGDATMIITNVADNDATTFANGTLTIGEDTGDTLLVDVTVESTATQYPVGTLLSGFTNHEGNFLVLVAGMYSTATDPTMGSNFIRIDDTNTTTLVVRDDDPMMDDVVMDVNTIRFTGTGVRVAADPTRDNGALVTIEGGSGPTPVGMFSVAASGYNPDVFDNVRQTPILTPDIPMSIDDIHMVQYYLGMDSSGTLVGTTSAAPFNAAVTAPELAAGADLPVYTAIITYGTNQTMTARTTAQTRNKRQPANARVTALTPDAGVHVFRTAEIENGSAGALGATASVDANGWVLTPNSPHGISVTIAGSTITSLSQVFMIDHPTDANDTPDPTSITATQALTYINSVRLGNFTGATISTAQLNDLSNWHTISGCLLYTSPSPRDATLSRMPSSA